MSDLLIELFSEEIPARMQGKAAADLQKLITDGMVDAGLTYASAGAFSTPRRLALSVEGVSKESPTLREERKGPRTDAPEKAVEGFLRSTGLSKDQLEVRDDKKGQVYFAVVEKTGRPAADIIAEVLENAIRNFPWPKSMRWGAGTLKWVRPLHSILCILSDEEGASVVPLDIDGIQSGDTTKGHRFLAPDTFSVTSFEDYTTKLKRAKVVLDAKERADHIWADATNQAFANGLEIVEDKGLLTEVAGLVEWPVVLMGEIAEDFLELPPEVLQTSMKEHQKFFSVRNPKTGRIERFVTVANVETADNGATILAGNQKVLFARLSDAKFFWENDLRVAKSDEGMDAWTKALDNVTFHNKLGSQSERIARIEALAREIAPIVGADADEAAEAARLAKADLSSEMIYEFPELQGLMGRYYAQAAGKTDAVAAAVEEHYSPLGPSDDVPTAPVSVAVALADKIDLLTGFWAIDEKPTGSKDPFALRRAALGVIRLVLENGLQTGLNNLVAFALSDRFPVDQLLETIVKTKSKIKEHKATIDRVRVISNGENDSVLKDVLEVFLKEKEDELAQLHTESDEAENSVRDFEDQRDVVPADLLSFFHDRLKVYLRDQGIRHDVIDACIAMPGNDDFALLVKRAKALSSFMATDDGENMVQGYKRAANILAQAEEKDGVEYSYGADLKHAEQDEEKALFAALETAKAAVDPALEAQDFEAAMAAMAGLRGPIDAFFEGVKVNADSDIVRRNRLNLLSQIRSIGASVADLTQLEG